MKVTILRLDHRKERDKRITTHVALAGRALGAEEFVYSGEQDGKLEESVRNVAKTWGGKFRIKHVEKPLAFAKKFKGEKVHLTFYGLPFQDFKAEKGGGESGKLLAIVGGPKVPREYYSIGKNVAVTSQPHSEVSALALFLYSLNGGKIPESFPGWERKIIPSDKGKAIMKKGGRRKK